MYKKLVIMLGLITIVATSGCASMTRGQKGALIGGGAGALVGGVAGGGTGALIGAAGGALVGGVIGHSTSKRRRCRVYYRNGRCKEYFK